MTHTTVLYHGPTCNDGFGAALAAWMQLGDTAEYVPVMYGEPPPPIPADHAVYVVDFSYPYDVMLAMIERHPYFVLLDHHMSSRENAKKLEALNLPHVEVMHELDECGATLTWAFFHGHRVMQMPELFCYLRDADLWKWELPQSRECSAALYSYEKDFVTWNNFITSKSLTRLIGEGAAIRRAHLQLIRAMVSQTRKAVIDGHIVPAVNATILFSEVAHDAMHMVPGSLFGAYYTIMRDGRWRWGMRGENHIDLSVIAQKYGGGGHPNAAGFIVDGGIIQFCKDE